MIKRLMYTLLINAQVISEKVALFIMLFVQKNKSARLQLYNVLKMDSCTMRKFEKENDTKAV